MIRFYPKTPRALALHVGATYLDRKHYSGKWNPLCEGAIADVGFMQALANSFGFTSRVLFGKSATTVRLKKELRSAARQLGAGDMFLLSYSGHGGTAVDISAAALKAAALGKPEEERRLTLAALKKKRRAMFVAGWALHDRIFLNDEFDAPMSRFKEGVRIVVVVDACFGGDSFLGPKPFSGTFPKPVAKSRPTPGSRRIPPEQVLGLYLRHQDLYNDRQEKALAAKRKSHPLRADGVLLAACRGREEANAYFKRHYSGVFTESLLQTVIEGSAMNYRDLIRLTKKRVQQDHKSQHPICRTFGTASRVVHEDPFRVVPRA